MSMSGSWGLKLWRCQTNWGEATLSPAPARSAEPTGCGVGSAESKGLGTVFSMQRPALSHAVMVGFFWGEGHPIWRPPPVSAKVTVGAAWWGSASITWKGGLTQLGAGSPRQRWGGAMEGVYVAGTEPWRQPRGARGQGEAKGRNIKISGRGAAAGYSVIKLKHLIKLEPLITGCCHVGVIYSNCGSGMEEQMFQSCWCH